MSDERAKQARVSAVDNGYALETTTAPKQDDNYSHQMGEQTHTVHETFASLVNELRERFGEGGGTLLPCGVVAEGYTFTCTKEQGHSGDHVAEGRAGYVLRTWPQS